MNILDSLENNSEISDFCTIDESNEYFDHHDIYYDELDDIDFSSEWMITKNFIGFIKKRLLSELEYNNLQLFNAEQDMIISLSTSHNQIRENIKFHSRDDLLQSKFNKNYETRILIPGSRVDSIQMKIVRDEYLKRDNLNVFLIEWRNTSQGMSADGAGPLQDVSEQLTILIQNILDIFQISHSSIYLIGHGIGAHVAGFISNLVEFKTKQKIGTILGVDPVEDDFPYRTLNKTHADYVEIIRTTKKPFDSVETLGHVNFYTNEIFQSICFRNNMIDGLYWKCAHNMALIYFAASINLKFSFPSIKCELNDCFSDREIRENWGVKMGGEPSNMKKRVDGVFWFETKIRAPFL